MQTILLIPDFLLYPSSFFCLTPIQSFSLSHYRSRLIEEGSYVTFLLITRSLNKYSELAVTCVCTLRSRPDACKSACIVHTHIVNSNTHSVKHKLTLYKCVSFELNVYNFSLSFVEQYLRMTTYAYHR
jgi:hypothetical protein